MRSHSRLAIVLLSIALTAAMCGDDDSASEPVPATTEGTPVDGEAPAENSDTTDWEIPPDLLDQLEDLSPEIWGQLLGGFAPVAAGARVDLDGTEFIFEVGPRNSCYIVPTPDGGLVFNGTFQMADQKAAGPYGSLGDNAKGTILGGLVLAQGEEEWAFGTSGTLWYVDVDEGGKHIVLVDWSGTAAENFTTELRPVTVRMVCVYVHREVMSAPGATDGMPEYFSDLDELFLPGDYLGPWEPQDSTTTTTL